MRLRRGLMALIAGVVVAAGSVMAFSPSGSAAVACSSTTWAEGVSYTAGQQVTHQARLYQALVTHTAWAGAGWTPSTTPTLWRDLGECSGGGTTSPSPSVSVSVSVSPSSSPSPSVSTSQPACAVKGRPAGKVLQGYWENWDGASNGVHPGMGWIPINDSRITQHGYNVLMAAFPVIRSDGTVLWENGMDAGVKVPTPAEICAAKARGATVLMSIGGAAAGIDLSSSAVADRFVATIVPILKAGNFDGIDIDIETGLSGSGSITTLSPSQANLIRIIDGVLAAMPPAFGLTMAPETAYVTGGSVTYGSIWGSYLPVIKRYLDNGRLWWLNMQYYNGSMYGCSGDSYAAGTVQGFTVQTQCLNNGLTIQGTTIRIPYDKQVPGLPAQPGAGGGYMTPSLVTQAWNSVPGLKGLMTWSINWDGSKGWTFGDTVKGLQGR
ncbi:putative glycosyl hydrolase [Actinoplanes missouriensis 431]|uniref:chitinase n=1 Tax=Actinoplanes missouriensis (strain ATCC 14538 / DSM 43046 / CBS 188.64 / JCM 3121 / NBRC 102363 / NCIMB 12654 / NRRL B-3342 / UNCC 431) TaxID=512565 RepID=I0HAU5_ACTM4|nr:glycosyl hydrolase family 18 protein [Actinoplanes missouriensis]BAL90132.1 putative glycosyl hydrolase [Actinoplanes missouriensis 431]